MWSTPLGENGPPSRYYGFTVFWTLSRVKGGRNFASHGHGAEAMCAGRGLHGQVDRADPPPLPTSDGEQFAHHRGRQSAPGVPRMTGSPGSGRGVKTGSVLYSAGGRTSTGGGAGKAASSLTVLLRRVGAP